MRLGEKSGGERSIKIISLNWPSRHTISCIGNNLPLEASQICVLWTSAWGRCFSRRRGGYWVLLDVNLSIGDVREPFPFTFLLLPLITLPALPICFRVDRFFPVAAPRMDRCHGSGAPHCEIWRCLAVDDACDNRRPLHSIADAGIWIINPPHF